MKVMGEGGANILSKQYVQYAQWMWFYSYRLSKIILLFIEIIFLSTKQFREIKPLLIEIRLTS